MSNEPAVAQSSPQDVLEAWVCAFNDASSASLSALYDSTAVLWGTVSPTLITTPEAIRNYFDIACAAQAGMRVTVTEVVNRVEGNVAMLAGGYSFNRNGTVFSARFTFVMIRRDVIWRIMQHHSSLLPSQQST